MVDVLKHYASLFFQLIYTEMFCVILCRALFEAVFTSNCTLTVIAIICRYIIIL